MSEKWSLRFISKLNRYICIIESQNDGYALCGFTVPDFTGHPPSHHPTMHGAMEILVY